jgi:1-aminocyclopropane-1-carboxylate deaminase/D-cysteine desulfhydrase-like pyridoxal-dependent ACC family enzyme
MKEIEQRAEAFFRKYEDRFNQGLAGKPDVEGTAAAFAESFIESSPVGVNAGQNGAEFRKAIPQGIEFYKSIGTQSMKIKELAVTLIDDFHVMAKVHWDSRYQQRGRDVLIEFDVVYFLRYFDGLLKIFAYVTGDEQKLLEEYGLVSPEEGADS